ncbi:LruC domain-containing protein [Flammeovirga agarivorans]|uniref:LruC domain-containing protein n=1 Tax=Flammeovirga agarivorans TaxID=2726742 RepID=A0A7X8SR02_9BACT|nr:LruC domain-containing protein [Flammeovirga agarivorans]NLR94814.1 LruC domain-containing protein [Flammeovirga agarivorans]
MRPLNLLSISIVLFLLIGCTNEKDKEINTDDPISEGSINDVTVPSGFDYKTTKTIYVKVSSSNFAGSNLITAYLSTPAGEKIKMFSGLSDENGVLNMELSVPTYIDELYISKQAAGLEFFETASIATEYVNVEFDVESELVPFEASQARKSNTCNDFIYVVNGNGEFFSINLDNDLAITDYPDLSGGSFAATYDRENNIIYYDVKGKLYSYVKETGTSTLIASLNTSSNNLNDGYPRMVINPSDGYLYIAAKEDFAIIDPSDGSVVKNARIQGISGSQNGGGDFDFSSDGTLYQVSSGGMFRMAFNSDSTIINATRISADNFPHYLTGVTIDRFDRLYASTNHSNSKLIQMDINDGSYVILRNMGRKMNDLSSFRCTEEDFAGQDADGDGVVDGFDLYPNDSTRAFESYTPGENGFGTYAFEDLYPAKGDYDFNDIIVHYRHTSVSNADNKIVEFKTKYIVKTVQSDLPSGFAFELPIHADSILSVTGSRVTAGAVTLDSKGLESGIAPEKPVVVAFDDHFALISRPGKISKSDEFEVVITFTEPIDPSSLPIGAFNPFIFINKDRTKEVHLANFPTTSKFNQSLQTDGVDDGNFKTAEGHPWAIHLPHKFHPPKEAIDITNAYSNFENFVESSGSANSNWYTDDTGNRVESKMHLDNEE